MTPEYPNPENVARICEEAAADESRYAFSSYDDSADVLRSLASAYPALLADLTSERSARERAERLVEQARVLIQKTFEDVWELQSADFDDMRKWLMDEAFPPKRASEGAPSSPAATEPETPE